MVKIIIFHPFDPNGNKVGGAEAFIKGVIKYAPEDFDISLIGITSNPLKSKARKWNKAILGGKKYNFFPLLIEKEENRKHIIPISLRYAIMLKIAKLRYSNALLLFNRIEPAIFVRHTKVPKIAIIHNDIQKQIKGNDTEVFWSKIPKIYFWLESAIFKHIDHVYTVSKGTLDLYLSRYEPKGKFSFLPTWVDTAYFYPPVISKQEIKQNLRSSSNFLPSDKKWVLFVGRLQEQKAPLRLIDTFHEFHKNNKNSCLIVIGDGNLRKVTENQVKKHCMQDSVIFLGNLSQDKLAAFYQASDVLLLTSNFEGMPMCVLESLGCGTPVVTTDVGEVKRVVKNGYSGEVVNSLLEQDIANALDKVLKNLTLYNKNNCLSAVAEFTPLKVLIPLYEEIRKVYFEKLGNINICNVEINNVSFDEALNIINELVKKRLYSYIVTPNVDHIMKLQKDSDFKIIYKEAALVLADGMPLIWASELLNTPLKEKISGSDLFPKICEAAAVKGYRIFFLGGREGAAERAALVLKGKFPNLNIVGTYCPRLGFENKPEENSKIVELIRKTNPDILFVGLGAPKQEKWIYKYYNQYKVPVSIGIGISFEFISGMVKRAPDWMQKCGLEWLWRLTVEPKRLWKRYLIDDPVFFWLVLKQKLGLLN